MTMGSVFAGVGGFDLGFERAGVETAWQVEINAKSTAVLQARFPRVARYVDVREVGAHTLSRVDVLCAGFPCQDVSVAGQRRGLVGERTGLFWEAVRLMGELAPDTVVLENVPGLLSSHRGRDFAVVVAALVDRGYGVAWRVLDSRWFGVAQRRRRVFLVGCCGGQPDRARAILFEPESGDGDLATRQAQGSRVVATLRGRAHGRGVHAPGRGEDDINSVTGPLGGGNNGIGRRTEDDPNLVYGVHANQRGEVRTSRLAGTLSASRSATQFEGVLASALTASAGHHGHSSPRGDGADNLIAATLCAHRGRNQIESTYLPIAGTLQGGPHGYALEPGDGLVLSHALTASKTRAGRMDPNGEMFIVPSAGVRRLTPLECERLQGFPDGWTCLCEARGVTAQCTCSDSPRYRMLGNAVTVSVAEWIAQRIRMTTGPTN